MEPTFVNKEVTNTTSAEVIQSLNSLLQEGIFRCLSDGKILFCNSACTVLFGYTSEATLSGMTWAQLVADDQEGDHLFRQVLADGAVEMKRVLFRKRNGSNFWGQLSLKRSLAELGVVIDGCLIEISEWRKAEDQLADVKIKLEKTSAELDRFIYSASHNMRSPITSMKGLILLLEKESMGNEHIAQYSDMLRDSLRKLERYVDELAGFAKITNQRVSDSLIDPKRFLDETLRAFNNHPHFSRMRTRITVRHEGVFFSDPDRLQAVLLNVVKNCFDYCDVGKTTSELMIDVFVKTNKMVVEVFDNGIGIPSAIVDRVFDLFYRATALSVGPGVGLYIAREAAARLGGTISLQSEYGMGTSVQIEIPNSRKGRLVNQKRSLHP